ncbi:3-oxoacyl-ACP reductase [Goodfellowiella coeruleoviolacea]|uniref:3-oxoacyl-[acyl-carrier protein] reductase n=1 Tax=Goodfellowiella coeruleoviolacea TaxID=334858 RepID=A0AAE3KFC9_9PSEU|nr:3-oxoacyl-ACP reductase [Goodfellowiella coeruleoviolacea]MCP2166251.1 3-oxoacyl-[acyl-carrier protein] reductase [Goodfellowiella coeruleoviolacea]
MTDRYQRFATSGLGRRVVHALGLPNPHPLRRHRPGQPVLTGPVLVGGAPGGRLGEPVGAVLSALPADVHTAAEPGRRYGALVFDATGITRGDQLRELHAFFHPVIRALADCGRVLVLASPPEQAGDTAEHIAQRALEGFTRSVGKELRRGATVQLVRVAAGAEQGIESTLRFLLSAKSAYVSGQVIRIGAGAVAPPDDWERPLAGRVALVTGASRGIGAAIAEVLARDGAHVLGLDVPAQRAELSTVVNRLGGSALLLDITAEDAPRQLVDHLDNHAGGRPHPGVDIVVHNAGITRDRTLGRLDAAGWDAVLAVNLTSQERINAALLAGNTLRERGRIIGVSSIAGIAGNAGQTNYATSKAGVIGMVTALAPRLAERRATINAVAPGFIETAMTAAVPLFFREAGRRLNSMAQGGLPVDVAETVAWFAHPASGGVTGNVVRVCGQSLLGA